MIRAAASVEASDLLGRAKYLTILVGILLCSTAVMLYWYGSYTFTPLEYHILTLPIFVAGLVLMIFNPQTLRELIFPIIFLAFLIHPPSEILYSFGSSLSMLGSQASSMVVSALGVPSTIKNQYGNPTIIVTRPDNSVLGFSLDIACSGIYTIMGFLVFAVLTAYIVRDKPWKKVALFFVGVPLIYLLNIVRIIVVLLIGYQFGEELALQLFHLFGGLVLLALGTLLLLWVSEKLFKTKLFTRTQRLKGCSLCQANDRGNDNYCNNCGRLLKYPRMRLRKIDIATLMVIAASIILLMSIQTPTFALTEGLHKSRFRLQLASRETLKFCPSSKGTPLTLSTAIRTLNDCPDKMPRCCMSTVPTMVKERIFGWNSKSLQCAVQRARVRKVLCENPALVG